MVLSIGIIIQEKGFIILGMQRAPVFVDYYLEVPASNDVRPNFWETNRL